MNDVHKFIENLNIENKCVVAAISGGPDSMYLIDLLVGLKDKLNLNIVVAHVHHNLRKESDLEAIKVEEYCKDNNLIFEMFKIEEYPNNKFNEEIARKIRYDFFDKIIKKYNSDILFTAHHADDVMETVLMRITRGSNLKGYAGIKSISNDRGYIIARPLVYLTKKEIVQYLDEKGIWYAKDMSNESEEYTRNRYRKNILPELKKENDLVHLKFKEFSEKLLKADEYIEKQVELIYKDIVINNCIVIDKFNKLDEIIKLNLLEKYFKEIYKDNIVEISYKHINIIIYLLKNKNNSIIDLPLNKKGILEYNLFKIVESKDEKDYEYTFTDKIKLPNGKTIEVDNNTTLTSNYVIHLNSKDIKLPFHVRNKKEKDFMRVKNMNGTKKVSDIFTDSKISKEIRDMYPIVLDDNGNIIWIPGVKKSNFDRKKEGNYDIILKYS